MTEQEIKDFFILSKKDEEDYTKLRSAYTDEQIAADPVPLVTEILKKSYGFPISFMDEAAEELFNLSEEKSTEVYEKYAMEILNGYYEDMYDFTQELSDFLANFPDEEK